MTEKKETPERRETNQGENTEILPLPLPEEGKEFKKKKTAVREGILDDEQYQLFMREAGLSICKKQKTMRVAQLRIIYTLLYFWGLRVNEIRNLTKNQLLTVIGTGRVRILFRERKFYFFEMRFLPRLGQKKLKKLLPEIELLFHNYGFHYLGNSKTFSKEVFNEFSFAYFINQDMIDISKKFELSETFKSHSFRVGYITKLQKTMSLEKRKQIMSGNCRMKKEEIQDLLQEAFPET